MAASQRIFGGVIVATKYDWGDGNKTHSISLKTHQKNAVAKKQAVSDQQYDWSNPLTPDQVKSAVQSAVGAKYGAPESDLSTQIGQSQQTANTDIPAWYQSYITALQGAQSQASQAYASAQQQITPAASTGDPVADAANAQRSALANSFQGMQRTIGANTATNYGSQIAQAPLLQIGSQAQQGKQTTDLQRQLSNMKLESGDYGNTVLQGLRQDQQTYNTNLAGATAAEAAAGVKQGEDRDPRTGMLYSAETGMTQTEINNAAKAWTKSTTKPSTPKTPAAEKPYSSGAFAGQLPSAVATLSPKKRQQYIKQYNDQIHGDKGTKPLSAAATRSNNNNWNAALQYFRDNKAAKPNLSDVETDAHVPYDIAAAAYYWYTHGAHLTQGQLKSLTDIGVNVKPKGID